MKMLESYVELCEIEGRLFVNTFQGITQIKNTHAEIVLGKLTKWVYLTSNLFVIYATGIKQDGNVNYMFYEPLNMASADKESELQTAVLKEARKYATELAKRKEYSICWDRTVEKHINLLEK